MESAGTRVAQLSEPVQPFDRSADCRTGVRSLSRERPASSAVHRNPVVRDTGSKLPVRSNPVPVFRPFSPDKADVADDGDREGTANGHLRRGQALEGHPARTTAIGWGVRVSASSIELWVRRRRGKVGREVNVHQLGGIPELDDEALEEVAAPDQVFPVAGAEVEE